MRKNANSDQIISCKQSAWKKKKKKLQYNIALSNYYGIRYFSSIVLLECKERRNENKRINEKEGKIPNPELQFVNWILKRRRYNKENALGGKKGSKRKEKYRSNIFALSLRFGPHLAMKHPNGFGKFSGESELRFANYFQMWKKLLFQFGAWVWGCLVEVL